MLSLGLSQCLVTPDVVISGTAELTVSSLFFYSSWEFPSFAVACVGCNCRRIGNSRTGRICEHTRTRTHLSLIHI